jgi:hypothetical protein
MANRTYKIRRFTNGQSKGGVKFTNYSLTIPAPIAEKLPVDMQFGVRTDRPGNSFPPGPGLGRVRRASGMGAGQRRRAARTGRQRPSAPPPHPRRSLTSGPDRGDTFLSPFFGGRYLRS